MRVKFFIRKSPNTGKKIKTIQANFSNDKERFKMSTKLSVDRLSDWDAKNGKLINESKFYNLADSVSVTERNRLERIAKLAESLNRLKNGFDAKFKEGVFSKEAFQEIIDQEVGKKADEEITESGEVQKQILTLVDAIEHWAKVKKSKISHNHWRRHKSVKAKVEAYGDVKLNVIDEVWLEDFIQSLVDDGMLNTSIGKYHSCISSSLKLQGINLNYQHGLKTLTTVVFLEENELADFEKQEVPEKLQVVKDGFLFECYTGVRFSDIAKFSTSNLITVNGKLSWRFVQQKTRKIHSIPLSPKALAILDKYKEFDRIPLLSQQRMNLGIKDIGELVESLQKNVSINKLSGKTPKVEVMPKYKALSTHVGRHTAATTWLMRGMPYPMVAEMLGVDIKTVKVYVEITDKAKFDALEKYMY